MERDTLAIIHLVLDSCPRISLEVFVWKNSWLVTVRPSYSWTLKHFFWRWCSLQDVYSPQEDPICHTAGLTLCSLAEPLTTYWSGQRLNELFLASYVFYPVKWPKLLHFCCMVDAARLVNCDVHISSIYAPFHHVLNFHLLIILFCFVFTWTKCTKKNNVLTLYSHSIHSLTVAIIFFLIY